MPDVLEETVPDVGTKVREYIYTKAMGFVVKALEFEHVCLVKNLESRKGCKGSVV